MLPSMLALWSPSLRILCVRDEPTKRPTPKLEFHRLFLVRSSDFWGLCSAFPILFAYRFTEAIPRCQAHRITLSNETHRTGLHKLMAAASSAVRDSRNFVRHDLLKKCQFDSRVSLCKVQKCRNSRPDPYLDPMWGL